MNISDSEYEKMEFQPRSVFQLCEWTNGTLRSLETDPDFEERYWERKGKIIKKLLEEAVPVARLGLHLWRPWHDVSVTCLAADQPHDAEVTLKNPRKSETIKIEVTSTQTEATTMRRQALARHGYVWMIGPVWREDRQIMSNAEMEDYDKKRPRLIEHAFARFKTKAEQEDDPQTAILVYVDSFLSLPFWYRMELLEQTHTYLRTQRPTLYGAYNCYERDQGIDGLRNNPHDLVK
jgi:hypothetical protein